MKNVAKIILTFMVVILVSFTNITNVALIHNQTTTIQAATTGQANALSKAKVYLQTQPFSKKGLIKQLKFDGFTAKEAKYGAAKCGANWKEQAAKKAKLYLQMQAFSKKGLINQLKFDGFTEKEAKYGAKKLVIKNIYAVIFYTKYA